MVLEHKLNISLEEIPAFVDSLFKKLESCGINHDIFFDIRLSLEEALINAIRHGNKMDKDKSVFLKVDVDNDRLEIEVKDEGSGFDYENIPSPTQGENLQKVSGRGIFLMKNFMDKVEFSDGGSRVKMIKHLT